MGDLPEGVLEVEQGPNFFDPGIPVDATGEEVDDEADTDDEE